jgi:8-oxo-dGTP diphosphatase
MNVSPEKIITAAVAAVIFNEHGEVLLQKRRDVEKWCILSGHVEFGETVQAAMVREIFEETNASSEIVRLIGVYSAPEYSTYYYDHRHVQYIISFFEVRLLSPVAVVMPNEETLALRYFKLDELPIDMAQVNPNWLTDALDKTNAVFVR